MEFIFQEDYQTMVVRMYLKVRDNNITTIIGQKDGKLLAQTIDPLLATVNPLAPLLEMNRDMADAFMKAVADYSSKVGIKTENENLLKGKLEATERHLAFAERQMDNIQNNLKKVIDKLIS